MTHRGDIVLSTDNLSIDFKPGKPFWRTAAPFRAIDRVSFEIRKGDSVGIVGRNGAGKTTLLKALAGIFRPTSGSISRFTDSITLLALGVGYEPSIPASDNVVLNGMLLGIPRRDMVAKLDAIFDFAELREFYDMPIKNYSSGMKSRLAFATATHVQTDILLIDEVLAVGDRGFRAKSEAAMARRITSGDTIVLVSHQTNAIKRLCNRALWFERGRLIADGPPDCVVAQYEAS